MYGLSCFNEGHLYIGHDREKCPPFFFSCPFGYEMKESEHDDGES
jgi:hypothetical protein